MTPEHTTAPVLQCADEQLTAALGYVLGNPGKQIRARLTRAAYRAVTGRDGDEAVGVVATAIEWLHSYSLVHDDLPAMDNDDLRRGRPTVHKAFDEATAILVGDGLQAAAFAAIAGEASISPEKRLRLIEVVASAVGFSGMVGGQALDMGAENKAVDLEALKQIHRQKTGALIKAAVLAGGICGNASEETYERLGEFADLIGLAFQIIDDVLDVTRSSAELGKTAGKDEAGRKSTYVSLLGVEAARTEAEQLLAAALAAIEVTGADGDALRDIANTIVRRLS